MTDIPDLWPKEVVDTESSVTPYTILKRQAAALASKTKGIVTAKVVRRIDEDGDFAYSFKLVAPTINYSYQHGTGPLSYIRLLAPSGHRTSNAKTRRS